MNEPLNDAQCVSCDNTHGIETFRLVAMLPIPGTEYQYKYIASHEVALCSRCAWRRFLLGPWLFLTGVIVAIALLVVLIRAVSDIAERGLLVLSLLAVSTFAFFWFAHFGHLLFMRRECLCNWLMQRLQSRFSEEYHAKIILDGARDYSSIRLVSEREALALVRLIKPEELPTDAADGDIERAIRARGVKLQRSSQLIGGRETSILITGGTLRIPNMCACCSEAPQGHITIFGNQVRGRTSISSSLDLPLCDTCLAHNRRTPFKEDAPWFLLSILGFAVIPFVATRNLPRVLDLFSCALPTRLSSILLLSSVAVIFFYGVPLYCAIRVLNASAAVNLTKLRRLTRCTTFKEPPAALKFEDDSFHVLTTTNEVFGKLMAEINSCQVEYRNTRDIEHRYLTRVRRDLWSLVGITFGVFALACFFAALGVYL